MFSPQERAAFLRRRRAEAGEPAVEETVVEDNGGEDTPALASLPPDLYEKMVGDEQVILAVSVNGYGKRTSSFEYRVSGRGGKGIIAMVVNQRNGPLVASMPVEPGDDIMLVTDGGQLIRCPVAGIRMVSRGTQGVIVFNTAETEKVVAVERISDMGGDDEAEPAA